VTLGRADRQGDLFDDALGFCERSLPENSIFGFLARERDRLFPDELFADLFTTRGRCCVPPSMVATAMVLQRLEGLSDREAVERFAFDVRWRYAAGAGGYGAGGWDRFAHTVLVDMRARLRASKRPNRVFEVALAAAAAAGQVGRRRVLDSTPLYDAVATMDTVTLIRSALRGVLAAADGRLAGRLAGVLSAGDDDYASVAKPVIDWDDPAAREQLIDSRARDGFAVLAVLDGLELDERLGQAATLLATVLGQDLERAEGGVFRIARRVARDRVISTVDPRARHGHKTVARGFDGYKGHIALDPDSEIITAAGVTAGNAGDAGVATDLIADLHPQRPADGAEPDDSRPNSQTRTDDAGGDDAGGAGEPATVYGDSAYGTGEFQRHLEDAGIVSRCKTQEPNAPGGRFGKDRFDIDLSAGTVRCPAGMTTRIRPAGDGGGIAHFDLACAQCPLRERCTSAVAGRTITLGRHEASLARARARQADPHWTADYRATRPKVEREIGHLMRRKHGGRRARMRGATESMPTSASSPPRSTSPA
jgi:Transposase DDE domain/Transposase domain (DUF772)